MSRGFGGVPNELYDAYVRLTPRWCSGRASSLGVGGREFDPRPVNTKDHSCRSVLWGLALRLTRWFYDKWRHITRNLRPENVVI